jgi:DnaJ-class molecular chaperone
MKCPKCYGNKKIMGDGYIVHVCPKCKGVGVIDDPIVITQDDNANNVDVDAKVDVLTTKKDDIKRGRPKKK